jgi:hypothetical protein
MIEPPLSAAIIAGTAARIVRSPVSYAERLSHGAELGGPWT